MFIVFMKRLSIAVVMLGLVSCATFNYPRNAEEFKAQSEKSTGKKMDSYVVNRSISRVVKSWRKQAKKCLNRRITYRTTEAGVYHPDTHMDYKTDIRLGKRKIGVDIKAKMSRQILLGTNAPADGFFYIMVAEAYSIGRGKTRIEVYRGTAKEGQAVLSRLFNRWGQGKSSACLDLIKTRLI